MSPRISVCIAVYNGADTIVRAVESVLAQSVPPHELLVVDDGSTDGSGDLAEKLGCKVLRQPNQGLSAARQRLVDEAQGDWIALLDADDWWEPHKLERQIAHIREHGQGLHHTGGHFHYEEGRIEPRIHRLPADSDSYRHILPENKIIESSALVPKSALLEAGGFVTELRAAVGWIVWLRMASRVPFYSSDEPLVHYTIRQGSIANHSLRLQTAKRHVLREMIVPEQETLFAPFPPGRQRELRAQVQVCIGVAASTMAREFDRRGDRQLAGPLHREAIRHAPTTFRVWSRWCRHLAGRT